MGQCVGLFLPTWNLSSVMHNDTIISVFLPLFNLFFWRQGNGSSEKLGRRTRTRLCDVSGVGGTIKAKFSKHYLNGFPVKPIKSFRFARKYEKQTKRALRSTLNLLKL